MAAFQVYITYLVDQTKLEISVCMVAHCLASTKPFQSKLQLLLTQPSELASYGVERRHAMRCKHPHLPSTTMVEK